ncbi:MAG: G5 domain-containing protein [Defluviitaleaceae bacterium]|nr:G5 domain-containing protein [Defluviitaleaceae bacterium]
MPKDKQTNSENEGLQQLPKPIQLNLPSSRSKPARRLHEPDIKNQAPRQEKPPPRGNVPKSHSATSGKRYFDSAQKAYGQRRQRTPKAPKQKRRWWYHPQTGPILGQGDRLYTPPQPKQPFFPPHIWRVVRLWPLMIIGLAIVVMGMINVFSYNAWAVYLGGELIGHMSINREIEQESIHYDAVRHRRDILGADEVLVNETVEIRTVRAGRRELTTSHDMIRLISQNFTYRIMASAIYLEGERVATLRNEAEAIHVKNEVMARFINDDTILELSAFEEDFQIRRIEINADNMNENMDNPNEVIHFLERPIQDIHNHVIRSGDTQGALAAYFNTTVNMIGYLNDIASDAILTVGNILRIEITRPRLTVRTVDEIEFIERIPREIETINNPDKLSTLPYEVINEGRDGEIRVIQRITRLNGVQVGVPEETYRRELTTAVTRVIEVGTLESAIQTR